jgi:hypothetical protein
VVLVVGVRLLRQALIGKTAVRMTVDCPVAMLVHCAGMRMRLGFCGVNMRRDRRVLEAMGVAAECHGGMRGEDAKRVEHDERKRRREPMPSDRFEYRRHPENLRRAANRFVRTIQGRTGIANAARALSHF